MKKILAVVLLVVVSLALLSCKKNVTGPSTANYTIVFRQGVSPTTGFLDETDAFLYDYNATSNYGFDPYGNVGYEAGFEHMALQFFIDGYLPAKAVVTSVYLTMHCSHVYTSGNVIAYSLDQRLHESTDTWNDITDISGPVSDAVYVSAVSYYDFKLDNGMVQDWIDNLGSSFGVVLRSQVESGTQPNVVFDSNDNTNPLYRPMLTVYYSVTK